MLRRYERAEESARSFTLLSMTLHWAPRVSADSLVPSFANRSMSRCIPRGGFAVKKLEGAREASGYNPSDSEGPRPGTKVWQRVLAQTTNRLAGARECLLRRPKRSGTTGS